MKRRNLILAAFLLVGCRTEPRNLSAVLPAEAEGWTCDRVITTPPGEAPEGARQAGLVQWATADYSSSGKGRVTVQIVEMKGETSAFEMQQKFHEPDTATFYKGPLFVVVRRGTTAEADVQAFTRILQSRITPIR
jgi:hypothetical protein